MTSETLDLKVLTTRLETLAERLAAVEVQVPTLIFGWPECYSGMPDTGVERRGFDKSQPVR